MNKFIDDEIVKKNIISLFVGIIVTVIGGLINYFLLSGMTGWIIVWSILLIIPIAGVVLIYNSLNGLFNYESNKAYCCWLRYGKKEKKMIDEIEKIIQKEQSNLQKTGFIIYKKWLISKNPLIFVKCDEINWMYLEELNNTNNNVIKQKIKLYTIWGLSFEIECEDAIKVSEQEKKVSEKTVKSYNMIIQNCKNAIHYYNADFEAIWEKSPENFINSIKK